jgi:phosphoserine phosphatase
VSGAQNSTGRVAAFFDVDHTLIACNSARKWVEYLWRNNKISAAAALRSVWWLVKYRLSVLDYEQVTTEVVRDYAGQSVDELGAEVGRGFTVTSSR